MSPTDPSAPDSTHEKLAYEAPRIVETEDFETLALQCGKVDGPQCEAAGGQFGS